MSVFISDQIGRRRHNIKCEWAQRALRLRLLYTMSLLMQGQRHICCQWHLKYQWYCGITFFHCYIAENGQGGYCCFSLKVETIPQSCSVL